MPVWSDRRATVGGVRSVVEPSCSCACGRGLSTTRSWTTAPPVGPRSTQRRPSPSGRSLHPRAAGPCARSLRLGPRPRTPASHKYASWPSLSSTGKASLEDQLGDASGDRAVVAQRGAAAGTRAECVFSWCSSSGAASPSLATDRRTGTDRSAARTRAARTARRTACALRSGDRFTFVQLKPVLAEISSYEWPTAFRRRHWIALGLAPTAPPRSVHSLPLRCQLIRLWTSSRGDDGSAGASSPRMRSRWRRMASASCLITV